MSTQFSARLAENAGRFIASKNTILNLWVTYEGTRRILKQHAIEASFFVTAYASGVFDYFMAVIAAEREIGDCPVMTELLEYLKDREVSADELFLLCSHFRRAMIDISYELAINDKALFDEISYVYDLNFAGVLKRYTDTIYQKEREIERNVKLLEEYRRAIDVSAIVSKTDAEGIITYANDKLSRVCGYSPETLVGSPHSIMRHPDMPKSFFRDLWQTIKANRVFKGTIKNRTKTGMSFFVDTTIVPITDTRNRITEFMAISYEVTDLVVAKEEAIAAGEAKEYFLSNMSHEIRTPLNAVLGFVALLKDEATRAKERRYLDIIHNSGENLLSIINDILDFSKLRSGEFTVEAKPFNLHHAISHTLELFVPSVNRQQTTMTSFIDPRIPYELISDPLRIQQVISNLLSNAIKFTPPFGEIRLEAFFSNGTITISISDTGIGIAQKDIEHIFDPFCQACREDGTAVGGTGLGLSISAQLVRHMGGEITVVSRPGIGSTFSFTLPVSVGGKNHPGLMDIARLHRLRLALLEPESGHDAMMMSLRRYLGSFGIEFNIVKDVSESFDLLFFSNHGIPDLQRQAIIADKRPAVALMDLPLEMYDAVEGVTPLVMPLYCAKLQEVLDTALSAPTCESAVVKQHTGRQMTGRVLVAEDNEANRELIRTLLENAGIDYTLVGNGAEALAMMKKGGYDLVLMDEQMPVMGGAEAVRKMHAYEDRNRLPHLPVIAITADVLGRRKNEALYDGFVGKPIRVELLHDALAAFLPHSCIDETRNPEKVRLDRRSLRAALQVSEEQLDMLLEVYGKKMRETLAALLEAVTADDLASVARLAHLVKGSSSNFRLEEITTQAQLIETSARAGYTADYLQMYRALHAMFHAIEKDVAGRKEGAL